MTHFYMYVKNFYSFTKVAKSLNCTVHVKEQNIEFEDREPYLNISIDGPNEEKVLDIFNLMMG